MYDNNWLGETVHRSIEYFYLCENKSKGLYSLEDIHKYLALFNIRENDLELLDILYNSFSFRNSEFSLGFQNAWKAGEEYLKNKSRVEYLKMLTVALALSNINLMKYNKPSGFSYLSQLYCWLILDTVPKDVMKIYDIRKPTNMGRSVSTGGRYFREGLMKYSTADTIRELEYIYEIDMCDGYSSRILNSVYSSKVLALLPFQISARYNELCGALVNHRQEVDMVLRRVLKSEYRQDNDFVTIPLALVRMLYRRKYILPTKGVLLKCDIMRDYDISDLYMLNYSNEIGDFIIEVSYNKGGFILNLSKLISTVTTYDDFIVLNFVISFFMKSEDIDGSISVSHRCYGNGGFDKQEYLKEDILAQGDFEIISPANWLVSRYVKNDYERIACGKNETCKEILIQSFTRKLVGNHTASTKAINNAKKYCLDVPNGYTFVDSHVRCIRLNKITTYKVEPSPSLSIPRIG